MHYVVNLANRYFILCHNGVRILYDRYVVDARSNEFDRQS